jgi:glycosyltransferase involved in cell wall biosynthesis
MVKKVLIAHQSTIPHYRVEFYNTLARMKPEWWDFYVVFDEKSSVKFFKENVDIKEFIFNIEKCRTFTIKKNKRVISFQTFLFKIHKYDLVIVEDALNNLSYPLAYFFKAFGIKLFKWGHGIDFSIQKKSVLKSVSEWIKLFFTRISDGFLAYTNSVKNILIQNGINPHKIYVLNNTINIIKQRELYLKVKNYKNEIKQKMKLDGKKILLYVGRLDSRKRIDFLLSAYSQLCKKNSNYCLIIIGGGEKEFIDLVKEYSTLYDILYLGIITDYKELTEFYSISDLYVYPGDVGLGPLQALCCDLIPVVIQSNTHNPEIEYLNENNSLILKENISSIEYAAEINLLIEDKHRIDGIRNKIWDSIKHLTLENMALNFINAINNSLKLN